MSESTATATVPEWDLADRMRKALRVSGVGVQEMADYLDVARNTVSTWINGRITPNRQTQRLWALRCGVSYEWISTGTEATGPGPGTGIPVPIGHPASISSSDGYTRHLGLKVA